MEKKKRKTEGKTLILYGVLSIMLPNIILLYIYNQEFGIISIASLLILASILGVVDILLMLIIYFFTKKEAYSLIVLSVFWLFFWRYVDIYTVTSKVGITSKFLLPIIFSILIVLIIVFHKIKRNAFVELFVCLIVSFLFLINFGTFIIGFIVYQKNDIPYQYQGENVVVDSTLPTPNIYWIHCDGMLSFSAVEDYFGYSDSELYEYLEEEKFYINEDAWMEVGHLTMKAIPSMTCPDYYDAVLQNYFEKDAEGVFENDSESNRSVYTTDLVNAKISNELVEALKQKGYEINVIGRQQSYFCFYADNFYRTNGSSTESLECIHPRRDMSVSRYKVVTDISTFLMQETMISPVSSMYYSILYNEDEKDIIEKNNSIFSVSNSRELMGIEAGVNDQLQQIDSPQFCFVTLMTAHAPFGYDENGNIYSNPDISNYIPSWIYTGKLVEALVMDIKRNDPNGIIIIQGDHGCHTLSSEEIEDYFEVSTEEDVRNIWNSVISAIYIPENYITEDMMYLDNPLNISRYLVNNYVGQNYLYLE